MVSHVYVSIILGMCGVCFRVELTVNLPKLEPFTRDHHASWVIDSRNTTPELDDPSLPCKEQ